MGMAKVRNNKIALFILTPFVYRIRKCVSIPDCFVFHQWAELESWQTIGLPAAIRVISLSITSPNRFYILIIGLGR